MAPQHQQSWQGRVGTAPPKQNRRIHFIADLVSFLYKKPKSELAASDHGLVPNSQGSAGELSAPFSKRAS